jgi:hypothetical protein
VSINLKLIGKGGKYFNHRDCNLDDFRFPRMEMLGYRKRDVHGVGVKSGKERYE